VAAVPSGLNLTPLRIIKIKKNGNTKKLRNRICVVYIERISVGNTEYSSSV
jgi:hypothetical protein